LKTTLVLEKATVRAIARKADSVTWTRPLTYYIEFSDTEDMRKKQVEASLTVMNSGLTSALLVGELI
jgi:hypothetical protein